VASTTCSYSKDSYVSALASPLRRPALQAGLVAHANSRSQPQDWARINPPQSPTPQGGERRQTDRPSRSGSGGGGGANRSYDGGDRPNRSYDGGDRPNRSYDGGANRSYDAGDRPNRSYDGGDRPNRSYDGGDRPNRSYDGGDRPNRSYDGGDRANRSYDGELPPLVCCRWQWTGGRGCGLAG
jgi:hypothetical protein